MLSVARSRKRVWPLAGALTCLATLGWSHDAAAGTYRILLRFNATIGESPLAVIEDGGGNFYGTTLSGGKFNRGTVYKLASGGKVTVLHNFSGYGDGMNPLAGLLRDKAGNLYGTTISGGVNGVGVLFKITPKGSESILHAFSGGSGGGDGALPSAGLIADTSGNLYGTTTNGGGTSHCEFNCGTVFEWTSSGSEKVLYAFQGGNDGAFPRAALFEDARGDLYGTTSEGGGANANCQTGCGTVFRLAPDGTETILHSFTGGSDGISPVSNLIADTSGNLYGTTATGGIPCEVATGGCGTVFKLAPDGAETILHDFQGSDGALPQAGVLLDVAGNLYGTTNQGGSNNFGTVFQLAPDGTELVLHNFGQTKHVKWTPVLGPGA